MTAPQQRKLKITGPVVITANRLRDGAVVYRTGDSRWTTCFAQAVVTASAPEASRLLASAGADELVAVGAYVAPVRLEADGRIEPGNLREGIRAGGPTVARPAPGH